jgi:hypothetical protein
VGDSKRAGRVLRRRARHRDSGRRRPLALSLSTVTTSSATCMKPPATWNRSTGAALRDAHLAGAEQHEHGRVAAQHADLAVPRGRDDHVGLALVDGALGADDRDGQSLGRHQAMSFAAAITSSMPPFM